MMVYYRVFGLTFRSDREIPDLNPIRETQIVDYSVRFDTNKNWFEITRPEFGSPFYTSSRHVKGGQTVVEVSKTDDCRKFLFRFYDGTELMINQDSGVIWVTGGGRKSLQAAAHHLLFSLPGFLLGLRKSACLHGAAIRLGDVVIALLGKSNSGKSVLSAQLALQGIQIYSDDLVALDVTGDTVKVYPGYPWIGLRPSALHWLPAGVFGENRACSEWYYLDEAYVTWGLRRMGSPSQSLPRKLAAIYLLEPVEDSTCEPAIEQIPRHQALMELMEAANRTHIPYPEFRAQEFSLMGSVVTAVPAYRLRYHLSVHSLKTLSGLLVQPPGPCPRGAEA